MIVKAGDVLYAIKTDVSAGLTAGDRIDVIRTIGAPIDIYGQSKASNAYVLHTMQGGVTRNMTWYMLDSYFKKQVEIPITPEERASAEGFPPTSELEEFILKRVMHG